MASAPSSPLRKSRETQRTELTALERQAEKERQTLLRAKHAELDTLAKKEEDHRRYMDQALAGKKKILDEMKAVRDKTHSKLRVASARGVHDVGVADRALARAARVALTARGEADRWTAFADAQDQLTHAAAVAAEGALAHMQKGSSVRVAHAKAQAEKRIEHGFEITRQHAHEQDQIRQRHAEQCETLENSSCRAAWQKTNSAHLGRRDADMKVTTAMDRSARDQMQSAAAVNKARKAADEKVAAAKQALVEKRFECDNTLQTEKVCRAQARNIAQNLKEDQELERITNLSRLEEKLRQGAEHARKKAEMAEAELAIAAERNEAWQAKMRKDLDAAHARVEDEETNCAERVRAAKVMLGSLQAQCDAYLRELLDQWEAAKRADEAKVAAARERTEELLHFCEQHLQQCQEQSEEMLRSTRDFAHAKKAYLEERVAAIDDMSRARVDMMKRQSSQRREQAERQLAEMERHLEDVKMRCDRRASAEEATANEKLRMTRERFDAVVQRAELRAQEAVHERDQACLALAQVASRCEGAAREARRRGLTDIAELIDPPPEDVLPQPEAEGLADSMASFDTALSGSLSTKGHLPGRAKEHMMTGSSVFRGAVELRLSEQAAVQHAAFESVVA